MYVLNYSFELLFEKNFLVCPLPCSFWALVFVSVIWLGDVKVKRIGVLKNQKCD